MSNPQQAMVVLASEQVWPNIHGLVHWQTHEGGLSDLCIYHTKDPLRSIQPAKRLEEFVQQVYPGIQVHLPSEPLGIMPHDVRNQVRLWQHQLPGRRWIINATGGLKPMFAGAIACCDLPDTEVVYRELSGDWYRWVPSPEGPRPEPFSIDIAETDSIPIEALVKVQYNRPPDARWEVKPVRRLPILRLVQEGLKRNWNWPSMFQACGLPTNESDGHLFEEFVGACLLELGIQQVCKNIILQGPERQCLQEIDIAANNRGQLLVIDCKLRTKEEEGSRVENLTSQIRQAYTTCRELGGIGARLLLLRPGRIFSVEELELAEALRLQVLDNLQTMDFFRKLAKFCGFQDPLPPQLQDAQALLDQARSNGVQEAFSSTRWSGSLSSETPLESILPLGSDLEKLTQDLHQDWIAYQIDQIIWIRGKNSQKLRGLELQRYLNRLFSRIAGVRVDSWWLSNNETTYHLALRLAKSKVVKELKQFLANFIGKSLLTSDSSSHSTAIP